MSPLVALSGFVVGVLVGLTGIGGGALMAPMLIIFYGTPPSIAVGTDLAYSIPMKWLAAWQHHRQGHVQWSAVWLLARGSIPAALVGSLLVTRLVRMDAVAELWLKRVLGGTLLLVALLILWHLRPNPAAERAFVRDVWYHHPGMMSFWGAVVGFLVGVTSIGSGSLLVPFLLLLPLSAREVVGIDIAHAALLVSVAGLAHYAGGTVDLPLTLNLLLGAMPGVFLGSRLSRRVPDRTLRGVLAVVLAAVSLHLIGLY